MAISRERASAPNGAPRFSPHLSMHGNIARLDDARPSRSADQGPHLRALDFRALNAEFDEVTIDFDENQGALWCMFNHAERPCFTPRVLDQIKTLQTRLRHGLRTAAMAGNMPLRSVIWGSSLPGVWNLGGDLALFTQLIRAGAEEDLRTYAYACIDTVHNHLTNLELPLLTIALVQGDALGGGFEAALTNDVIIAERDSKFGLPEVLFNMFPGMGAYSLLCRRLDGVKAQELILSGRLYGAEELEEMGLVDLVVDPGEGVAAVRDYLDRNKRRHGVLCALSRVRQRCQPVSYEELVDITEIWVETALRLEESDLRRMEHLARAQTRRHARACPREAACPRQTHVVSAVG
jgi:DSF synthase